MDQQRKTWQLIVHHQRHALEDNRTPGFKHWNETRSAKKHTQQTHPNNKGETDMFK